jgi:cytochrome b561
LLILRACWRLYDRAPRDEPMPRWQRLAAHATHGVLYLFMLALPLSGWIYNSANGNPLQWFKQFNLPALMGKNEDLAEIASEAHEILFWILIVVLIAHVGGALVHHWLERDNTLLRMLPFARLRARKTGENP